MTLIAVLSDEPQDTLHDEVLQRALANAGVENEIRFVQSDASSLRAKLDELKAEGIHHVRFGGSLPEAVPSCFDNWPSTMLSLKAADALVPDEEGRWWPRNFMQEGLQRLAAIDLGNLDLTGGAFLVGATPATRSIVAALARIGFYRLNLTDLDEAKGRALIEELKRSYFNVQFQFTPRGLVTQLPGVHSIAVNTVDMGKDPTRLSELFYFNFLKSGAVWIETIISESNSPLIQEARNVGADVRTGGNLISRWDEAWAEGCFKVKLDAAFIRLELDRRFGTSTNS